MSHLKINNVPTTPKPIDPRIARCLREIERCESELRAGNVDMEGILLGLFDWSVELRLIEEEYAKRAPSTTGG
jgi:hypothetical protein